MPQLELSPFLCPVTELSETVEVRNTEASYGKHRMGGREVGTERSSKREGLRQKKKPSSALVTSSTTLTSWDVMF